MHAKLVVGLLFAGLAVIFILQNAAVVEVRFLVWSLNLSQALLMFLLLAAGMVIGWILYSYLRLRKNRRETPRDN